MIESVKQPQDRKAKAVTPATPAWFTFTTEGSTYTLPPGELAVPLIPGQVLRDAYMDGEEGQMRLGFQMLEHVDTAPGTLEALYAMPAPAMLEVIKDWMEYQVEETDATVGES